MTEAPTRPRTDPRSITRPEPALMKYYAIVALLTGPAAPIVIIPLFFRYETLRYRFDDRGVSMAWGILFKREVYLTYRRVQDIHVTRNFIERWLGLAKVSIQTASGAQGAEMVVEGVRDPEALRDFLYMEMRGAKHEPAAPGATEQSAAPAADDEALTLLREIRDELRQRRTGGGTSS